MAFKYSQGVVALLAVGVSLGVSGSASANVDDLKKIINEGKGIATHASEIKSKLQNASAATKAKYHAKAERLHNIVAGFELVGDALVHGRPMPVYLTHGGVDVKCGEKVWVHNTANDKTIKSYHQSSSSLFNIVQVNADWGYTDAPNMTVMCKDKADGAPLVRGDAFMLSLHPKDKSLDDGKPCFYPPTKADHWPTVRMESCAKVAHEGAYWTFRGGTGPVQTGIPMELVSVNRGSNGNIAGFCATGPDGASHGAIRFEFHNHCDLKRLGIAFAVDGVKAEPEWAKDLKKEAQSLYQELQAGLR